MVLHGIALYDLVFYTIYFACYCVVRFVARAVSRKTPIPLIFYIFLSFLFFYLFYFLISIFLPVADSQGVQVAERGEKLPGNMKASNIFLSFIFVQQ